MGFWDEGGETGDLKLSLEADRVSIDQAGDHSEE